MREIQRQSQLIEKKIPGKWSNVSCFFNVQSFECPRILQDLNLTINNMFYLQVRTKLPELQMRLKDCIYKMGDLLNYAVKEKFIVCMLERRVIKDKEKEKWREVCA